MNRCAASQVTQLQRQLAVGLKKESQVFGTSTVAAIQSQWTTFMRGECTMEESGYQGGSIEPLIYGECKVSLLVSRIAEIRKTIADLPD